MNSFKDWPYREHAPGVKEYLLVTMGFHLGTLVAHVFQARKYDFFEMALHHVLALYLYGGCYFFNAWECGAVIALVHDSTEILLCLTKVWAETVYSRLTTVVFFAHLFAWFYVRLVIYPQLIYGCWQAEVELYSKLVQPFFCYLLSCLFCLHCYWFTLMLNIVHYNVYGKLYAGDEGDDVYDEV